MGVKTTNDYYSQLRQLLPPGPAWDPDYYPNFDVILQAIAPELARVDARAHDLQNEMFPGTINELLPDWERVMKLPDACMGATALPGERKQEVLRRFTATGEQRAAYFESIANRFGYPDARVHEWRAPRWGRSRFGRARFGTWSAQFVWELRLGARRAGGARFGFSVWGSRFGANPNDIIECIVRRYAPAHTVVIFNYE
jgi:uncharacterized protein YmfQ (DUF2313 family)